MKVKKKKAGKNESACDYDDGSTRNDDYTAHCAGNSESEIPKG